MDDITCYRVGEPYPDDVGEENLTCVIDAHHGRLHILLKLVLANSTLTERMVLRSGELKLAVVASPPLAWIVLTSPGLDFDAPYAIGLEGEATASRVRLALSARRRGVKGDGQLIELHCIDKGSGTLFQIRLFSLSCDWMLALAEAVASCTGDLELSQRDAVKRRDNARWPTIRRMLSAARIVEVAGKV